MKSLKEERIWLELKKALEAGFQFGLWDLRWGKLLSEVQFICLQNRNNTYYCLWGCMGIMTQAKHVSHVVRVSVFHAAVLGLRYSRPQASG